MKILLSPSKTLHLANKTASISEPIFSDMTNIIVNELKILNINQLKTLFVISDALAKKVDFMIHQYKTPFAAIGYYKGEAYRYLDSDSWDETTQQQAQQSLRILCAQHGYLKPYDAILPYRMDFLVDFDNLGLPNPYLYWTNAITQALKNEIVHDELIFNLASKEFSSVIDQSEINDKGHWIIIDFHLVRNNQAKTVSMLAKKARGIMARALLENPIHSLNQLFTIKNVGDFTLDEANSTDNYLRYTIQA